MSSFRPRGTVSVSTSVTKPCWYTLNYFFCFLVGFFFLRILLTVSTGIRSSPLFLQHFVCAPVPCTMVDQDYHAVVRHFAHPQHFIPEI